MKAQVVIVAGGFGTRLQSVTGDLPKPMAPILGKPVLEHQIRLCKKNGFTRIALLLHYGADSIRAYFGDGSNFGVHIIYVTEQIPRGTAGALIDALDEMDERFIVLYGDTYADVDLIKFWDFDSKYNSAGSLLLHPNDHPNDSDIVQLNQEQRVIAIHPYPRPDGLDYKNLVNAALYILDRESLLNLIPSQGKFDIAKDLFVTMLNRGMILMGYQTPEYIKDMGTPSRIAKVESDILNGVPERLSSRHMRRAVLLDRDGTLNEEVDHLKFPEQVKLLPNVPEAIRSLNLAGVLAVCVTNQPVIARGDVSWDGMYGIHSRMDRLLGERGAYLDRLYFCPHHPDAGYLGEVAELKVTCNCRKPATGLIDLAVNTLNIDRRRSWLIGDSTSDLLAGQRAGLKTILVKSGYAGRDFKYEVEPNFVANDLQEGVNWALSGFSILMTKLMPIAIKNLNARLLLIGGPARSGKSTAANVISELFNDLGRNVSLVRCDDWLKPKRERLEGSGVALRYLMEELFSFVDTAVSSKEFISAERPKLDRKTGDVIGVKTIEIFPNDLIVLEGVPALLDERLVHIADGTIFLDISDESRLSRLRAEYEWRGNRPEEIQGKLNSRELDEVAALNLIRKNADHVISLQGK